jgi:hypothetical protein
MRFGTRVGKAYVSVTADGSGINEEIVNSVDEAGPGIEKAGDRHGEKYGDHFSDGFFDRMRERFKNRGEDGAFGFNKNAGKSAGAQIGENLAKSLFEKIDALGPETSTRLRSMFAAVEESSRKAEAALARVENDNGRSPKRLDNLTHAARTAENAATRMERAWRAALRAEGLLDVKVSRNRGGGSRGKDTGLTGIDDWLSGTRFRNNAINILAKSLGGLIHGFEKVALLGKTFVSNMAQAEEGASIFAKISAGFGGAGAEGGGVISKVFSSIAASGPGALVAIAAVSLGLTVLISILNALLAVVVALASTIVSALVGSLLVLGGAIAAVTAAAGLLVVAFTSMTDAQQKVLKGAFMPLKAELTGIGQIMLRDMVPAFATWSANLQRALLLVVPVAQVMGKAFAEAGNSLTRAFSGPGFKQFAAALAVFLPTIVTRLADALGSFLNGLLGVFSVLLPYVSQFATYLSRVAARFADWATSAKGQNAIKDFVDRALNSLRSLWSFLGAVGGLIKTVLLGDAGQQAGNNIFDSMTVSIRRFTAYLSKDDRLKKWFEQGVQFAYALGQSIVTITRALQQLNQSGAIDGIARLVEIGAGAYSWFARLPGVVQALINPLVGISKLIGFIGSIVGGKHSGVNGTQAQTDAFGATMLGPLGTASAPPSFTMPSFNMPSLSSLIGSGMNALNNTSIDSGGFKPKKQWKNPYIKFANSLIQQGPSVSAQIKNAMISLNKAAASGIREASRAKDADSVVSAMDSLLSSLTSGGEEVVNTARSALSSAAQTLASATTKAAAKNALRKVRAAQRDLKAALADQRRINAAAAILSAQKVVKEGNVLALLAGLKRTNATLADYAEARSRLATMLEDANQKLTDALQLRDSYKQQVADSIKSFGSLLSAQAQTIDGVEQALTANDVTSNLQAKLAQIQKFQSDLRILLASGLSNDAYKQIVDAGVEQGTTIADALLAGGIGAIQQTNTLVGQINGIADSLGSETSSRLYQAGVDAAQGLVDGLTSLSAQLDSAAYALGTSIALAVKRALGIASLRRGCCAG